MKHVVITGSTRGIGFGLADTFLNLGCAVTLSGRAQSTVDQAVEKLNKEHAGQDLDGIACDVREYPQVQALWKGAFARFGKIDIWINNAGLSGPQTAIWQLTPEQAQEIVTTNLLGVMYGSMVALEGMLAQGFGGIYNMEGMGSDGRKLKGLASYGTTKYAVHYFTECLVKETRDTPLVIGSLRPGMVITDLINSQYTGRPQELERVKGIFNLIADRVENVAPWMAKQILANQKSGACINYFTATKLLGRLLSAPFHKRDLFDQPAS